MSSSSDAFTTVRVEGAILPVDLLQRIAAGDARLEGLRAEDYHLAGEKINEATNHAWNRLLPIWEAFRAAAEKLPTNDSGQSLTLTKWLLPLWRALEYGQLEAAKPFEIDGKYYPVSHVRYHSPIHLVSFRQDLDKRIETIEGKRPSPHGLVQEFLNRSEQHLWGFVSNGLRLRILRDNIRLTRQAFVEFDLQAMFDGKIYADFALLWRLCHESRVMADKPEQCWLERWSKAAQEQGLRALDQLRGGVEKAIEVLGRGFLHPDNAGLLDKLRAGTLKPLDYYRQLLRLVYRLLFLFVAEDRGLLFDPKAGEAMRERYTRFYSTARLRRIAEQTRGTQHTDLYRGLELLLDRLGTSGCPELGLPALGGLFELAGTPDLASCRITNADLLEAVRALSVVDDERARAKRPVDYRNLGSEELGSIYESLLELHPRFTPDPAAFVLTSASGHERKTTGSYYTPTNLITCLLDSALDPVLDEICSPQRTQRAQREEKEKSKNDLPSSSLSSSSSVSSVFSVVNKDNIEDRILDLKVCDPACGSGHFLIAAAHRIAKKLASVRTHEDEPAPDAVRHALRDVIGRCVFGVDANPMAVELCQVALWMEALEPGKPLSFLKHHIQCGNSLLGTTPALLAKGIPDTAFEPIEGDDKRLCRAFKKQNKEERRGEGDLFADLHPWERLGDVAAALAALDTLPDDTAEQVRAKERQYEKLIAEGNYRTSGHFLADLWCAAFVWKKTKDFDYPITERIFRRVQKNPHDVTPWMYDEVRRLVEQYQFLHWHLAFPGVFQPRKLTTEDTKFTTENTEDTERRKNNLSSLSPLSSSSFSVSSVFSVVNSHGWRGGFDVVLGNPPWERIKLQEQEWFAAHGRADIAGARTAAARGKMIQALATTDPTVYRAFLDDRRKAEGESHFVRDSSGEDTESCRCWGMYPLCGRGDVNTYSLFAELNRNLIAPTGRVGCIVPSGIATDDTTKVFFQDLVETEMLTSIFHFENEEMIFSGLHHAYRFMLLTLGQSARPEFAFYLRRVEQLSDPDRRYTLSSSDFGLVNPNTRTCPTFRSIRDAALTKAIYRRIPVLIREGNQPSNSWGIRFMAMFHMANDSGLFRTAKDLLAEGWEPDGNTFRKGEAVYLPLYEAKMLHQFDHRWATYEGSETRDISAEEKQNPKRLVMPRYWVPEGEVSERLKDRWDRNWLLAWRDITGSEKIRTAIASVLPCVGVGHTSPLMLPNAEPIDIACLYANLCSFVLDYATRQKVGGTHLTFGLLNQLPILPPKDYASKCPWSSGESLSSWLLPRVLELTYTAWDLQPFAKDCGYEGPPFRWDEERRFQLRCELDAACFHLYLGGAWQPAMDEPPADFAKLQEAFPTPRHAVEYILDTFPLVRKADEEKYGTYRTKERILAIYDQMAAGAFLSVLSPPPGVVIQKPKADLGRLSMLIVILLQAAKEAEKTMTRDELTLGLALCFNPAARKAVRGLPLTVDEKCQLDDLPEYLVGLNEILVRQQAQGLIRAHEGLFLPGSSARPYNQVSQGDRDLIEEVVQAIAAMQPTDKEKWSLKLNARHPV